MITAKEARSLMPYEINKEENIEKELKDIEERIRVAAVTDFYCINYTSDYAPILKNKLLELGFFVTIIDKIMIIGW